MGGVKYGYARTSTDDQTARPPVLRNGFFTEIVCISERETTRAAHPHFSRPGQLPRNHAVRVSVRSSNCLIVWQSELTVI
jgi:hypothetical protein